jgi:DNA-binding NarL/FixJ family response regulator
MGDAKMVPVRILVVDDMPRVRQDLGTLLTLAGGIQVVGEASDGREAIRQAQLLQPDAVLMDLEMPILDGYAATRQIKKSCPGTRVIALTVHGYPEARAMATEAGVDDFVVKGASLDTLIKAIQRRR